MVSHNGYGVARPSLGCTRDSSYRRTIEVFRARLHSLSKLSGHRVLDVGCGEGTFTLALTGGFDEVIGIDVQHASLKLFRDKVKQDRHYTITTMSASSMGFRDDYFDCILSIETLEHLSDLPGSLAEFARVLRPGGECLVTVPNRWFPFENHGIRVGSKEIRGRVPLLPYLAPLHNRISLARVFTVRALDRLFMDRGFVRSGLAYLWPTFEHGGNPLQPLLRPLFGAMRRMEDSPLRGLGTSIAARYLLK